MGCGLSKAHIRSEVLVSHRNARTAFLGRLLIVERYRAGWPKAHVASAMGDSGSACRRGWPATRPRVKPGYTIGPPARIPCRPEPQPKSRPGSSSSVCVSDAGRTGSQQNRGAGPHSLPSPTAPPGATPGGLGPDDRSGDPLVVNHRRALRT